MRTDAVIDRKQVKLSNSSTIGFGKWKAQTGDVIVWNDSAGKHIGRIAGRIKHAPALLGDGESCRNMLLVITFSHDLTFVMERWVKQEQIERCYSVQEKQRQLLAFMFGESFAQHSPDELREWSESGFSNPAQYANYRKDKP